MPKKGRKITYRNAVKGIIILDASIDKEVQLMDNITIRNGNYCTWGCTLPPGAAISIDYCWDLDYPREHPELNEIKRKTRVN